MVIIDGRICQTLHAIYQVSKSQKKNGCGAYCTRWIDHSFLKWPSLKFVSKGDIDLNAHLDYSYHHARSYENWGGGDPGQTKC